MKQYRQPIDINQSTLIGTTSVKRAVYTPDNAKHIFCCGTTGSGKTVVLSNYIKSAISDTMMVNAFAIGRNTIAVTAGAIQTLTPDQIKGIMAHEVGHIANGHTKALLLNVVGNGIFTIFVMFFRLVLAILQTLSQLFKGGLFYLIFTISKALFNTAFIVFMYLGQIILAINSRENEYQADSFALEIGYGEELVSALYLLQKISMNYQPTLSERLKSSHPHIAKRIHRLEQILMSDNDPNQLLIT